MVEGTVVDDDEEGIVDDDDEEGTVVVVVEGTGDLIALVVDEEGRVVTVLLPLPSVRVSDLTVLLVLSVVGLQLLVRLTLLLFVLNLMYRSMIGSVREGDFLNNLITLDVVVLKLVLTPVMVFPLFKGGSFKDLVAEDWITDRPVSVAVPELCLFHLVFSSLSSSPFPPSSPSRSSSSSGESVTGVIDDSFLTFIIPDVRVFPTDVKVLPTLLPLLSVRLLIIVNDADAEQEEEEEEDVDSRE